MRYLKQSIVSTSVLASMIFSQLGFAKQSQEFDRNEFKIYNLIRALGLNPTKITANELTADQKNALIYQYLIDNDFYDPTTASEYVLEMSEEEKTNFVQKSILKKFVEHPRAGSGGIQM